MLASEGEGVALEAVGRRPGFRFMLVRGRGGFSAGRLVGRRGGMVVLCRHAGIFVDLGLQDQRDGGE